MAALNDLTQMINPPTPNMSPLDGIPPPVVLTPPAPVKSVTVVRTKPANTGNTTPNSPSAGTPSKASGSTNSSGAGAASAPSGKSKLGNYLSDVAGGLTSIPANANAISAFAYGFAGSIKAGDSRRLADKNAAIAAQDRADAKAQQQFNNDITLKNANANQLVNDKGGITPVGMIQISKDVDQFAADNGLKGATPADRQAAIATAKAAGYVDANGNGDPTGMIEAYRAQREQDYKSAYGYAPPPAPADASTPAASGPGAQAAPAIQSPPGTSILGQWMRAGTPDALVKGGTTTGAQPSPAAPAPAAPKPGAITGGGKTQDDPMGPFNEDADGKAAVLKSVPPGGYFVSVGADGTRTIHQRNK